MTSAIITDSAKRIMVDALMQDYLNEKYFIGIGKSDAWANDDTIEALFPTREAELEFRKNLQSVKIVEAASYVIPRVNWISGNTYYQLENSFYESPVTRPYYVLTEENNLFVCLQQGKNINGVPVPSTAKPTNISGKSFYTTDGYVWRFMNTLSVTDANFFLSTNFMSIKKIDSVDESSATVDVNQFNLQEDAVPGEILNITVTDGGSNYSPNPTIEIVGATEDGSGAEFVANVRNGTIVSITLNKFTTGDEVRHGAGYIDPYIVISDVSGSGAKAIVSTSANKDGFMSNPPLDLNSTYVMFVAKPNGTEDEAFVVGSPFRQVGLIRSLDFATGIPVLGASHLCLDAINFSSIQTAFTPGKEIEGVTSGARAFVDYIDGNSVYVHRNSTTGRIPFIAGEQVNEIGSPGSGVLQTTGTVTNSAINKNSGSVLYINNRQPILRDENQTEDLKIIVGI